MKAYKKQYWCPNILWSGNIPWYFKLNSCSKQIRKHTLPWTNQPSIKILSYNYCYILCYRGWGDSWELTGVSTIKDNWCRNVNTSLIVALRGVSSHSLSHISTMPTKKFTKIIDPMKSQVKYSSIQVFEYSSIWVFMYSCIHVFKYSSIQVFKYSSIEFTNWLLPITHYTLLTM